MNKWYLKIDDENKEDVIKYLCNKPDFDTQYIITGFLLSHDEAGDGSYMNWKDGGDEPSIENVSNYKKISTEEFRRYIFKQEKVYEIY